MIFHENSIRSPSGYFLLISGISTADNKKIIQIPVELVMLYKKEA